MAVWSFGLDALSARGASVEARQVGLGPGFIDKDQPRRLEAGLSPPPLGPRLRYVGAVLFAGAQRLFLYVSPSRASA